MEILFFIILALLVKRVTCDAEHLFMLLVCGILSIRAEDAYECIVLCLIQLVGIGVTHFVEYHDGSSGSLRNHSSKSLFVESGMCSRFTPSSICALTIMARASSESIMTYRL